MIADLSLSSSQLPRQGMELQHLARLQIPILEQRPSSTTPDITGPNSTGITTSSSVTTLSSTYLLHSPLAFEFGEGLATVG